MVYAWLCSFKAARHPSFRTMVIRDCPTLTLMMRSYLIWSISPFAPPTIPSFPRPPWRQLRSREIRYIYIVPVSQSLGRPDAEGGEGQSEGESVQS